MVLEQPVGNGNVSSVSAFNLSLTGLSGIGPVSLESYTCEPSGDFPCDAFGGGPNILTLTSDATSAFLDLQTVRRGEIYVFRFTGGTPVPEPSSLLLLLGGVAGLGVTARTRRSLRAR